VCLKYCPVARIAQPGGLPCPEKGHGFIIFRTTGCDDAAVHEVELKFQIHPARRDAVESAVAGARRAARVHLQALYFDTAERALAKAGIALRLRREGRLWVQTLKAAGEDGMTRAEHNVPVQAPPGRPPQIDPQLHLGVPVGERLELLLRASPEPGLHVVYGTDVWRRARRYTRGGATIEVCFDRGVIRAGERTVPVCELELELLAGPPQALVDEARRWTARHDLWLDGRSKAERGDLLARGLLAAPARTANPVRLAQRATVAQALAAVARSCNEQIAGNASQIAAGDHGPEHVHQLRVGLRRLRSALRLFGPKGGAAAPFGATLPESAAQVFRAFGAARDSDVLAGSIGPALRAALGAFAWPAGPEPAARPEPAVAAHDIARGAAMQGLLLDLLQLGIAPAQGAAPAEEPLRRQLTRRLRRWHRWAADEVARFTELDTAARHVLRKRIKRLRYAVEFSAGLFDAHAVRRYLKALRALQERLGEINDLAMAQASLAHGPIDDPRRAFALGWLLARHEAQIVAAAPALEAFAAVRPFWRKG
jgi:triphosphatase